MSFWHQKMFKNHQKVSLGASIQAKNEFQVLTNPPKSNFGLVYTSKRSSGCLKRIGNSLKWSFWSCIYAEIDSKLNFFECLKHSIARMSKLIN